MLDKKEQRKRLKELALVFLKLGFISFGGPAAHIAMMETEVVSKKKWMTRQHFLDLVGATNLIPGPNSTEMTMHCGYERAGWKGLFVAGSCFILPAVLFTLLLAYFYIEYGKLPEVEPFLFGIKPAVLSIIALAIIKLGQKALKSITLGILGALVLLVSLIGLSEVIALLAAGILGAFLLYFKNKREFKSISFIIPAFLTSNLLHLFFSISSAKIFWTFLKVGAILYGSGYVLFAYLDAELVATGIMNRESLMDAIAVGQFTPGPVLTTATFIGYQLGGFSGAFLATLGIFLPSFLFVLILNPFVQKMRRSKLLGYFLDCVNIAAVAVMLSVLLKMSFEVLFSWQSILIAILSFVMSFKFKRINVVWIILGSAIIGRLLLFF